MLFKNMTPLVVGSVTETIESLAWGSKIPCVSGVKRLWSGSGRHSFHIAYWRSVSGHGRDAGPSIDPLQVL